MLVNMFSFAWVDAEESARIRILDMWLEDWKIVDQEQHFVSKSIKWEHISFCLTDFRKDRTKEEVVQDTTQLGNWNTVHAWAALQLSLSWEQKCGQNAELDFSPHVSEENFAQINSQSWEHEMCGDTQSILNRHYTLGHITL